VNTSEKGVNTERFNEFIHNLMRKVPSETMFVMDKAPIHNRNGSKDIVNSYNNKLIFQSPYSPDLNPIEYVFGLVVKKN
jgi:transposase